MNTELNKKVCPELKTLAAELVAAVLERFVPTAETIVGLPDAARILNM